MVRFSFEQGSLASLLLVAAIAILLTAIFYVRAFGHLRPRQWQSLLALRVVAIVIVVVLIYRPMMSYHKTLEEKPGLVIVVDRSRSMSIADDASGMSRFNLAKQQVQRWWEKLHKDFTLHLIEFSERAKPLENFDEFQASVPDGKATSLSRALVAAAEAAPRKDLEAVVLLSDGIHNSARNPLDIAVKLGLVVHTVGVGATLRSNANYRDIQVAGVDCPDRLLLNNKAKITASVEAIGLGGHVCKVILEDNGQPIQDAPLTLDDIEGVQKVEFEFVPAVKGRHSYSVRIPPAGQEKVIENNQRGAIALVVEPGIRVLYLEGTLRAEYGALVDRFLSKDPDLEFCALVQTRRNVFLRRTNIPNLVLDAIPSQQEQFDRFDVFILGDLDSTFLKAEQQEMLVKRVENGAGVVMLGGYHSLGPGGYEGTPLGKVLPVTLGDRDTPQWTETFLPTLSPEGAAHPIFANVVAFFPTRAGEPRVEGLPALDGCTRVGRPKPGASVLATVLADAAEMPVLAVQPVGKGRSAVFTADTTRKWQQGPRALDQESPFLQFWGQMVRWLAGRATDVKNEASIAASTDKAFYQPEEPISLSAIVRDAKGEGTNKAQVEARITGPGGRPDLVALTTVPGPEGHYGGQFEPKEAGPYRIVVEAKVGDVPLKHDPITVEVGRPNLEFEKLDLDEKTLSRIAADCGGRYVHISTADHLVDQLNRAQRTRRLYFEKPLYWPPLFWLVFVGALTTEWALRKKYQLR